MHGGLSLVKGFDSQMLYVRHSINTSFALLVQLVCVQQLSLLN